MLSLATSALALSAQSLSAPTGTYEGTKSVLGQTVSATIKIDDTSHADIGISGAIAISCASEEYKFDGASTITLPGEDTAGDCVHDALADNKASIKSITYDASGDTITVTAHYIINVAITLKKSGATSFALVEASEASEKEGWFADFEKSFGKMYEAEERAFRKDAFLQNLDVIAARNRDGSLGTHFINKFSDLTKEEFKARYLGYLPKADLSADKEADIEPSAKASAVDWRGSKYVTPVKDQGQCGSCWAFSATEQIETDVAFATGSLLTLSPQQITSCDKSDAGCNGGNTETAYKYVASAGGLESNAAYPYTSGKTQRSGTCKFSKSGAKATIKGYSTVSKTRAGESKMLTQIAKSPISVCVDAESWQTYHSGVVGRSCGTSLDHCVQAVGYQTSGSNPYWIVRNSWGTSWGQKGFIYVQEGINACGIAKDATITTGAKLV